MTEREQDYAEELFSMSRFNPEMEEDRYTVICEREWCAFLSGYIIRLENELQRAKNESQNNKL